MVKTKNDYHLELEDLIIDDIIYDEINNEIIFKVNKTIRPYVRHRKRGNGIYDPLSKYKEIFREKLDVKYDENFSDEKQEILKNMDNAIEIEVMIYKIPPSTLTIEKLMNLQEDSNLVPFVSKPDVDNYIKTIMDIINGYFWKDDSQNNIVSAKKQYSLENKTIVKIRYINKIPSKKLDDYKEELSKEEYNKRLEIARKIKKREWS